MQLNRRILCIKCRKGYMKKQKIGYYKKNKIMFGYTCSYCTDFYVESKKSIIKK